LAAVKAGATWLLLLDTFLHADLLLRYLLHLLLHRLDGVE
jgi:hypothetical protein